MSRHSDKHDCGHLVAWVVLGVALMVAGVAAFMRNLGFLDLALSRQVWPLALIFFGILHVIAHGPFRWGGHAMILGGLFWLLGTNGHQALVHHWWPLSLVWIGLVFVARAVFCKWDRSSQGGQGFCDDTEEGIHDTRF